MKQSNLTFAEGFLGIQADIAKRNGAIQKVFDWNKAAQIIKDNFANHPDLVAEAGLQGDWDYTGGIIFENGKPSNNSYTYLSSNWATPTLLLFWDGDEQEEIECYVDAANSTFTEDSKWDENSIAILGIPLA